MTAPSDPRDLDEIDEDFEEGDDADLNCGLTVMASGRELCMNAGTEWCDFDCPFHDEAPQFRRRIKKPKPAPLLDLMEKPR